MEHLSADDLGTLGEALLDFTQASDLDDWLQGQHQIAPGWPTPQ